MLNLHLCCFMFFRIIGPSRNNRDSCWVSTYVVLGSSGLLTRREIVEVVVESSFMLFFWTICLLKNSPKWLLRRHLCCVSGSVWWFSFGKYIKYKLQIFYFLLFFLGISFSFYRLVYLFRFIFISFFQLIHFL